MRSARSGQLVDREDAAVGVWDQAVVHRQLIREVAPLGDLDRIHLADEVGDRDVGSRELLGVALGAVHPADGGVLALLVHEPATRCADGGEGVLGDLDAVEHRRPLVEERGEAAEDPSLRLPALAEEDNVLRGEDGVLKPGQDRLVVPDDPGEEIAVVPEPRDQVEAHLLAHRPQLVARLAQLPDGCGSVVDHGPHLPCRVRWVANPSGDRTRAGRGPGSLRRQSIRRVYAAAANRRRAAGIAWGGAGSYLGGAHGLPVGQRRRP